MDIIFMHYIVTLVAVFIVAVCVVLIRYAQARPRMSLLLTTLGAVAASLFWAFRPLFAPVFFNDAGDGWKDADIVRAFWHFRLVQPEWEWVSMPPNSYYHWTQAETLVRFSVVFLTWLLTTIFLVQRSSPVPVLWKMVARKLCNWIFIAAVSFFVTGFFLARVQMSPAKTNREALVGEVAGHVKFLAFRAFT